MKNVQEMFALGMKRVLPELVPFPEGPVLNLGCGNSPIAGAINLDWPHWDGERGLIEVPNQHKWEWLYGKEPPAGPDIMVPCPNESIAGIHAYHFLEHLTDPRIMIREMQRVLMPGGVANIVVPHYSSAISVEDLDHKKQFALDTWKILFSNEYYAKDHGGWQFTIGFNAMMAITERNTVILTQLIKE